MHEREAAMHALGDTPEGRALRVKMQSDLLISDMSAFKAANPGSCLADFVRWHSPRDWIEDDVPGAARVDLAPSAPKGALSARMREPGNVWGTLWRDAPRASAASQRLLFDPIREGEKALHFLENVPPPAVLFAQLLAAAAGNVGHVYASADGATLEPAPEALERAREPRRSYARETVSPPRGARRRPPASTTRGTRRRASGVARASITGRSETRTRGDPSRRRRERRRARV